MNVCGPVPGKPHCIPVITIGGFLGAGKTTLVNNLLAQAGGRRIVVFVNDFGAINIDYQLVETVAENRISLKNGCVCCSLNDDLVRGITDFARQSSPPDAIVIEASGVADPRALDHSIQVLSAAGIARAECRVVILDAAHFASQSYEDSEDLIDQAAASDLVLLNKADLASPEQLAALKAVLEISAPGSSPVETTRCDVPIEVLLQAEQNAAATVSPPGNPKNHGDRYESWSAQSGRLIDRKEFDTFAALLATQSYRAKGQLRFCGEPEALYTFNLVGQRAELQRVTGSSATAPSVMIAIGKAGQLDRHALTAAFARTAVQQTAGPDRKFT